MTEQEQVQVTQADRDAAEALRGSPAYALGFYDHTPLVQAFARHRHTATSEALEAMREALTPSVGTKAAYMGEFSFNEERYDSEADEYYTEKVYVPWATVKEIMAAIAARAAIAETEGQQP